MHQATLRAAQAHGLQSRCFTSLRAAQATALAAQALMAVATLAVPLGPAWARSLACLETEMETERCFKGAGSRLFVKE